MMFKYTVTVECGHLSSRKWWRLGSIDHPAFAGNDQAEGKVVVYLHSCDGCAGMAEIAGIEVTGPIDDPRRN
jgi:hypothetical protein